MRTRFSNRMASGAWIASFIWVFYILIAVSGAVSFFQSSFGWTLGLFSWVAISKLWQLNGKIFWCMIGVLFSALFGAIPWYILLLSMGGALLVGEFIFSKILGYHDPFADTVSIFAIIFLYFCMLVILGEIFHVAISYGIIGINIFQAAILSVILYGILTVASNYSKYGSLITS